MLVKRIAAPDYRGDKKERLKVLDKRQVEVSCCRLGEQEQNGREWNGNRNGEMQTSNVKNGDEATDQGGLV